MMYRPIKSTAAIVLIGALPLLTLSGCESIKRETGMSKQTQAGVGAGATIGGLIAAIAEANPAWIAASTILGGVVGGTLSKNLTRHDLEEHASNQYRALDTLGKGQTSRWTNARTGHSGSTTVTDVFTMADGTTCKNFTEVIDSGDRTIRKHATACRKRGGDWVVRRS